MEQVHVLAQSSGWTFVVLAACLCAAFALGFAQCWSARSTFVHRTTPMSDEEFLIAMGGASDDATVLLALRVAIANACKVPVNTVRPDANPLTLHQLMFVGWDRLDLAFRLEVTLRSRIRLESKLFYGAVRQQPTLARCFRRWLPELRAQCVDPSRRIAVR